VYVARRPLHRGQAVERLAERGTQLVYIHICLREQVAHRAALLVEQRRQQVGRFDELVIAPDRETLRVRQRHLEFACQSIHPHGGNTPENPQVTAPYGAAHRKIKRFTDAWHAAPAARPAVIPG